MKGAEDQSHYTATSLPPGHKGSRGLEGSRGSRTYLALKKDTR